MRTPELQLAAEQSTREYWIPPKKDIPHPRAKERPQQDGWRGKITFRIKPLTHQRCSEGSNKPYVHQDAGTPTETEPERCLGVGAGQRWTAAGAGVLVQQTWVWRKPSWRRSPLTHHRAIRTYTELGNRHWEGTNRTLCAPGPRRKEQ